MVSIRLPVIEAERIRLFSLRRYSLANTQWCSTCPSSIYSCTLSSTRIWMMPSVKVIPKNCALSFLNRALMSIRRLCGVVKAKMKNAKNRERRCAPLHLSAQAYKIRSVRGRGGRAPTRGGGRRSAYVRAHESAPH